MFGKPKQPSSEDSMPRQHHYMFAYAVIPSFAFGDPRTAVGLGIKNAKLDVLGDVWRNTLKVCSAKDREEPKGDIVRLTNHVLLLITMPRPIKVTEAYFVGIMYPRSWLDDQTAYHSTEPDLRVFILAMSEATDSPDEGTLREAVGTNDHHAVAYGVHADRDRFSAAILALVQPPAPQPPPLSPPPLPKDVPSYFLSVNGDTQGPYTWGEVINRMGQLPQDAMIWHPNVNEWRPVRGMPLI